MNISDIYKNKKLKSEQLKDKYSLTKKYKALGLVKLCDKTLLREMRDGLLELPISFIIEIDGADNDRLGKNIVAVSRVNTSDLVGFDFVVCDNDIEGLTKYLSAGVTPIIIKKSTFSSILQEFNPIKNEGNAFLYEHENKWSIYGAIVRYMENYKFPMDNKNLVKNILTK